MRKFSILFFLIVTASLLSASTPSFALMMNVTGGYVNEPVTVTLDREAYVIFRINNGTPVFTYGNEVKFIPHISGNLHIQAKAEGEVIEKVIRINERSGGGGGQSNLYYSGTAYLPEGTFRLIAYGGTTYDIGWRTAMGALKAASEQAGFSFTIKETSWGPFVSCIAGKCEKSEGEMSGWMYQVNGQTPMVGAHEYHVSDGDLIVWYFSRSMDETPETSPMVLVIQVILSEVPEGEGMEAGEGQQNATQINETPEPYFFMRLNAEVGRELTLDFPENVLSEFSLMSMRILPENKTVDVILNREKAVGIVYGKVLKTFSLKVKGAEKTEIVFRTGKDVEKSRVVLMKFNGRWVELPTEYLWEDRDFYYFSAEIQNFSTFAVVEKWGEFPLSVKDEPIIKALLWLKTIQNEDGGFANPGEESSISKTSWAIMALAAAKQDPHKWVKNSSSPVDYLRKNLNSSLGKMGTADIARTILALIAANENPRNFSGIDLVSMLREKVKENGQIGDFIYTTIWGIMALKAAGENVSVSVEWLKAQQNEDGGFAWAPGEKSDYDDTAAAIQALIFTGEEKDSETIRRALDYLRTGQNDDGGFRYFGNSSSNAASDAWIIQALVAAGENPREWKRNGISVVDHLLSLQTEEGYFKYTSVQTSNPGYMTVCAVMALLGKPNPIKPDYLQGEVNLSALAERILKATPEPAETPISTPVKVETPSPTPTPAVTATEEVKAEKTPEAVVTEKAERTPGFEVLLGLLAIALAFAWRKWEN